MRRTIKIKVDFPKENLLMLMKTCSQVFNIHVDWAFTNHSFSKQNAHKNLYDKIRIEYPNLPSGLLQSVRDTALESVKANKFKFKPRKADTSGVRFDKRCASLRGNLLSISTLNKRVRTLISVPKYFQEVFSSWKFTGLQLTFNKQKQQFFACLNYEKDNPELVTGNALGIDRGLKNIVSCSNGYEVSGKTRNRIKRQRTFQRKQLQTKGTRSAKHRKRCLGGREKRFSLNENHVIAKELVTLPYQHFILEKLSKMNKKKHGKRFNRKISNWSYYQLEMLLTYKAEAIGKRVEYVDPRFTSQRCNACGHIARKNRNGEKFTCEKCGHVDGADINAAKNIRDLWLEATNPASEACNPERAGTSQSAVCLPCWQKPAWDLTSLQASPVGN
jgi:IS605 OrfB family transposase